jgi:hypothetical protein
MNEVEALIILGLVSLSWHHCRVLGLWLCWPCEHLTIVSSVLISMVHHPEAYVSFMVHL